MASPLHAAPPASRLVAAERDLGRRLYGSTQAFAARRRLAKLFALSADEVLWFTVPLLLALGLCLAVGGVTERARLLVDIWSDVAMCTLVEQLGKALFRRGRPSYAKQSTFYCLMFEQYSFPSGHSLRASFFAACAVRQAPALWQQAVLVLWAVLVAASRVALGKHFLADVVAGCVLGALAAETMRQLGQTNWFWAKLVAGNVMSAEVVLMAVCHRFRTEGFWVTSGIQAVWWITLPLGHGVALEGSMLLKIFGINFMLSSLFFRHFFRNRAGGRRTETKSG